MARRRSARTGRPRRPRPGRPGRNGQREKLVKQFDKNGDGWLNREERKAAREFLSQQGDNLARRGPGRPGGLGRLAEPDYAPARPEADARGCQVVPRCAA